MNIPWELDSSGRPASLVSGRGGGIGVARSRARYLAIHLLKTVVYVSAEFSGNYVLYRRRLVISIETERAIRVCGFYEQCDEDVHVPPFCMRYGGYSLTDEALHSGRILFPREGTDAIGSLLDEARRLVNGVDCSIKPIKRDIEWSNVYVYIEHDLFQTMFEYSTSELESKPIEQLCNRADLLSSDLLVCKSAIPDVAYGCKISYDIPGESIDSYLVQQLSKA